MPSTRISIENASGRWVAETELPQPQGGIRRKRLVADSLRGLLDAIWDAHNAVQAGPKLQDDRIGELALDIKADIERRRNNGETVETIPLSEDEFAEFISTGIGLDLWERRTPGKPLTFEGAVFAVPVEPAPTAKFAWERIGGDVPARLVSKAVESVKEAAATEEPPPGTPVHIGRPTKAGFWSKCRCVDCEAARDAMNNYKPGAQNDGTAATAA